MILFVFLQKCCHTKRHSPTNFSLNISQVLFMGTCSFSLQMEYRKSFHRIDISTSFVRFFFSVNIYSISNCYSSNKYLINAYHVPGDAALGGVAVKI